MWIMLRLVQYFSIKEYFPFEIFNKPTATGLIILCKHNSYPITESTACDKAGFCVFFFFNKERFRVAIS